MTSRTIHLPNSQNSLKTALFETNTVYRRYWLQSLHCLFIPNLSPFVTLIGEKGVFPKMLIQHNMKVAKKKSQVLVQDLVALLGWSAASSLS